jgi:signal transduction histidine kinase
VNVSGRQVAVVVHDPTTLADAATRSAVLAAVGLAAERTRLRAEVGRQVEAVQASRRRLLLAEDDERHRLAERIDRGPGTALEEVEELVRKVREAAGGHEALATALDRAAEQLAGVRPELDALVRGLGRVDAHGLAPALERLAAGLPFDVQLQLGPVSVSSAVGSVLFFVCSESLANVVKHAEARSVRVALDLDGGNVRLSIEDDGKGGADSTGSGLVGLADRATALGGRLLVVSPPGSGTRIVVELPLAEGVGVASPPAAAVPPGPIRSFLSSPPTME